MTDVTIKVLEPPTSNDLMTLEDAKIMLGIGDADTTNDEQLALAISQNSIAISSQCLRRGYGFGKQKVRETHRCVPPQCCPGGVARIWLMLWPVMETDIESVECPAGTVLDPVSYELEEQSGKLTIFSGGGSEIVVTYSGGYDLPDNAPLDLSRAVGITVREARTEAAAAAVTGIRMISHKSARVMFHSPSQSSGGSTGGSTTSGAAKTVQNLLVPYTRYVI
jgi:hypothetical protein